MTSILRKPGQEGQFKSPRLSIRKRHLLTDTIGMLLAVIVHPAPGSRARRCV
jgi:hypothetical protein